MTAAQIWKSTKFTIERSQGKKPGMVIFRLSGPFTARDMYGTLSPSALRNTFDFAEDGEQHALHILDLTEVPYMDSTGVGMIITHFVRCQSRGVRLIAVGVSPRVLELLELTKTDKLFPRAATVDEIESE